MKDRTPIRRYLDECDKVASYYPNAPQKVVVSRDVLLDWRRLDATAWRAEGWQEVGDLTPDQSDDDFRRALEGLLAVVEIQVVEAPPDYLEVTPL
jgi:hypothetical protein